MHFLLAGVPSILRSDRGTENSVIAFLQPAFRNEGTDSHAGEKSFQYGRSSANQVMKVAGKLMCRPSCFYPQ